MKINKVPLLRHGTIIYFKTRTLWGREFSIELEFENVVFVEGGKMEKNPRNKDENQQQTQKWDFLHVYSPIFCE